MRWCCSSACCRAPTPPSASPPRLLADLKEREPQYKALAKRVAQRAASGRAAKREAARTGARNGAAGLAPGSALDDGGPGEEPGLDGPAAPASDEPAGATAAGEPVPAGRASPRGATPGGQRQGPRQHRGAPALPGAVPAARRSGGRPACTGGDRGRRRPRRAAIKAKVRDVPDYPQPGVVFKDITPLLADGKTLAAVVSGLAVGHGPVDKVAGIASARGSSSPPRSPASASFGFVPVRKQGRLPGPIYARSYQLQYGTATIEVHQDAFTPGERVLIVDDVLATGGTAEATADLVRRRRGGGRRDRGHPGAVVPGRPGPAAGGESAVPAGGVTPRPGPYLLSRA